MSGQKFYHKKKKKKKKKKKPTTSEFLFWVFLPFWFAPWSFSQISELFWLQA
jgi:hypothetical protein